MKYRTSMKYRRATGQEVEDYYQSNPSHRTLVIEDLTEVEDIELEWGRIEEITEFVLVPDVGVVPTYVEDVIRDDIREPDWSTGIYEVYRYKIYKMLWFVAFYREEPDSTEIEIVPLNRFDEIVAVAERRASEFDEDVYEYWFEWASRKFSNGKTFVPLEECDDISISDLEEIESLAAPGYDYPEDLWASLFRLGTTRYFVGVNYLGSISLMSVDSESEAREVISEIWS